MRSVADFITTTLVEQFDVPADAITPDATFTSLELDSLVHVELIVLLQGEYGITIAEDEIAQQHTIAQAVEVVRAKVPSGAA